MMNCGRDYVQIAWDSIDICFCIGSRDAYLKTFNSNDFFEKLHLAETESI